MRPSLLEFDWYTWPSTSGNAFAAAVLDRIMPIPEVLYRGIPDIHLCTLSAVFGEVISLEEPGSLYRVHGANNWFDQQTSSVNLDLLRKILLAMDDNYMRRKYLFSTLYSVDTRSIGTRDIFVVIYKMISMKLDPENHPFKESPWRLFIRGCDLFVTHPDPTIPRSTSLVRVLWLAAMLLAPRPFAYSLVKALQLEKRGWLHDKLATLLKRA